MNSSTGNLTCSYTDNTACWTDTVQRMNHEHAKLMVPVVAMMCIFNVIGLLGNFIVIFVYANSRKRTTARMFMMYLAAIDLFACVTIHPYITYKLFHNHDQTWTVVCKLFEFLVHTSLSVSCLTLLAIAVDRYLAICQPVKFVTFYSYIEKAIAVTLICGFCMSLPLLEFYGPRPIPLEIDNITFVGYKCDFSEQYQGSLPMLIFSAAVMTGFLLQIACMTVMYGRVAFTAYRRMRSVAPLPRPVAPLPRPVVPPTKPFAANVTTHALDIPTTSQPASSSTRTAKGGNITTSSSSNAPCVCARSMGKRASSSGFELRVNTHTMMDKSMSSRLKTAKLLFLVTAVFFLSWSPFFILRVMSVPNTGHRSHLRAIILQILNHMFYMNNAANPIIYVVIHKSFREECKVLLTKMCKFRRT